MVLMMILIIRMDSLAKMLPHPPSVAASLGWISHAHSDVVAVVVDQHFLVYFYYFYCYIVKINMRNDQTIFFIFKRDNHSNLKSFEINKLINVDGKKQLSISEKHRRRHNASQNHFFFLFWTKNVQRSRNSHFLVYCTRNQIY